MATMVTMMNYRAHQTPVFLTIELRSSCSLLGVGHHGVFLMSVMLLIGFAAEPYMQWVPAIYDLKITGFWRYVAVGFMSTLTSMMTVAVLASAAGGVMSAESWWLRRSRHVAQ